MNWMERAACRDADPVIFHILSAEDPACENLGDRERKELELANFREALTYCLLCPVANECEEFGESSSDSEQSAGNLFSVYGGRLPKLRIERPKGRPITRVLGQPCPNGHPAERTANYRGRVECRECKNDAAKKRRGTYGKVKLTLEERHSTDEFDHPFVEMKKHGSKYMRCQTCYRAKRRISDKARRAANRVDPDVRHQEKHGHAPEWVPRGASGRKCRECERAGEKRRVPNVRNRERDTDRSHAQAKGHAPVWDESTRRRVCTVCRAAKARKR